MAMCQLKMLNLSSFDWFEFVICFKVEGLTKAQQLDIQRLSKEIYYSDKYTDDEFEYR